MRTTSTHADLLQRAATKLRDHAKTTAQSPADLNWTVDFTGLHMDGTSSYSLRPQRNQPAIWRGNARGGVPEYIALMHPPVALALAETFEKIAWMGRLDAGLLARVGCDELIATARAILREEA